MTATRIDRRLPGRTAKRWTVLLACLTTWPTLLLAGPSPAQATPISTTAFDAGFTATFSLEDIGRSDLFIVGESGNGDEATFGAFTYTGSVVQDLRRRPPGCGPNSSTAVTGSATLRFPDGDLRLFRRSGGACFSFPLVTATEEWVATSGTGPYRGATGYLAREWVGDVRFLTATGAWTGELRLIQPS